MTSCLHESPCPRPRPDPHLRLQHSHAPCQVLAAFCPCLSWNNSLTHLNLLRLLQTHLDAEHAPLAHAVAV